MGRLLCRLPPGRKSCPPPFPTPAQQISLMGAPRFYFRAAGGGVRTLLHGEAFRTGLGLAIVKRLLDPQDGTIAIESTSQGRLS
jgi:hypothetical protein